MKLNVEFHNKPWKLGWCLHHLCIAVLLIFVLLISLGQGFVWGLLNQPGPCVNDRVWMHFLGNFIYFRQSSMHCVRHDAYLKNSHLNYCGFRSLNEAWVIKIGKANTSFPTSKKITLLQPKMTEIYTFLTLLSYDSGN